MLKLINNVIKKYVVSFIIINFLFVTPLLLTGQYHVLAQSDGPTFLNKAPSRDHTSSKSNLSTPNDSSKRLEDGSARTGVTTLASVALDGTAGNGYSGVVSTSTDGRYIGFVSIADNIVGEDTNLADDIFIRDMKTGTTNRVSVSSLGIQGNYDSIGVSISADGRFVAFSSRSDNLVEGDTTIWKDVFVHDMLTGKTERVSVSNDGVQGNDRSVNPIISADGRYVAFDSLASNLVAGDNNHSNDVFVHDLYTGATTRMSLRNDAQDQDTFIFPAFLQSMSADGRFLVFASANAHWIGYDNNYESDIFVFDRQAGYAERVSISSNGTQSDAGSNEASISADGRMVAFSSYATNLIDGESNHSGGIYVHDRQIGETKLVSVSSDGIPGNGGSSFPEISANGRYVSFISESNNLVAGDNNGIADVFIHDLQTGYTELISTSTSGIQVDGTLTSLAVSADGRYVTFTSNATTLINEDTHGYTQVFVRDRGSSTEITHLEITQVIQDESNNVALIANKPTFVRVYVDCQGNCTNITGKMEVWKNDDLVGVLSPENGSIIATHQDWIDQRTDLKKTLNYLIPLNWLTSGEITFTAIVNGTKLSETKTFVEAESLKIAYLKIMEISDSSSFLPSDENIITVDHLFRKLIPTNNIEYSALPGSESLEWVVPAVCTGISNMDDRNKCYKDDLIIQLNNKYKATYGDILFGWLPDVSQSALGGSGYSDPAWKQDGTGLGRVAFAQSSSNVLLRSRNITYGIGQLLGASPTGYENLCENVGSSLPKIQQWGFDGYDLHWLISDNFVLQDPNQVYDYMSFCDWGQNFWVSPATYNKTYDFGLKPVTVFPPFGEAQSYFLISGLVFTNDTVFLNPVWVISSTEPDILPNGTTYCLETWDIGLNLLTQSCFDLDFADFETGRLGVEAGFRTMILYSAEANRILLKKGETVIAERIISDNSPQINLTYPNGGELWDSNGNYTITWTASDLDGDNLIYDVEYSTDGIKWLPIGLNLSENSVIVNAGELPGSNNARIKVNATDGMNTVNDESDATFTVVKKVPKVTIFMPEEGGTVVYGESILLQGFASDLEDGNLPDSSLSWTSNLSGSLGYGSNVLVNLTPGEHTITLSTVDSDGNTASSQIIINVVQCFTLSLAHSGLGSDPIASPMNSAICPAGKFLEGELVQLGNAAPDENWRIEGWYGSSNDASTLSTNMLSIPNYDTTVYVKYSPIKYIISGSVTVPGVFLIFHIDYYDVYVVSDEYGEYSIPVPIGWSGTVTPSKEGYTFYPSKHNYTNVRWNQTNQNFSTQPVLTFTDVPFDYSVNLGGIDYSLYPYIQALYDAGYTAGCQSEPLSFCPDNTMTRAESSVFMLRGNFGVEYTPPSEPWDTFFDDWTDGPWAEKWAEGMWNEGMTAGCYTDPLRYCPWDQLSRVQAAVFGLRMKYGMDYAPPATDATLFDDMKDVNDWGTKWAEQAYLNGLLPACGERNEKPLFCPNDLVTRAWGAYMIVIAKDLPISP